MQFIPYSPDIWVLHANILRYIVIQYVTPQMLEIVSRVVEPGEVFGPDEVDGGAAVVEEQAAKEHQWDEERRSKCQRHVN